MAYAFVQAATARLWPVVPQAVDEPVSESEPTVVEAQANVVSIVTMQSEDVTDTQGADILGLLEASGESEPKHSNPPPFFKSATGRARRNNHPKH